MGRVKVTLAVIDEPQIFIKGKVIETVPEDRIVDTLLKHANAIAEQMEADGLVTDQSSGPVVVPVVGE